jgi:hypothetical protein
MTARGLANAAEVIAKGGPMSAARVERPPQTLSERAALERLRKEQAQTKGQITTLEKQASEAKYPALTRQLSEAYKTLAKIDVRVAKAEAALKQVETNFGTAEAAEQLSQGPIKTVDIGDLGGTEDHFISLWGKKPPTTPPGGSRGGRGGRIPCW